MRDTTDFSDLQPYRDEEIAPVLKGLLASSEMFAVLEKLFPNVDRTDLSRRLQGVHTVADFQAQIMEPAVRYTIEHTIDTLTVSGLSQLAEDRCYLFISNHRDITLDSALLAYATYTRMGRTMEMAIGDNLVATDWIAPLFKLNKTVIVARGLSKRALFQASHKLSAYIHHLVAGGHDSFWIAQAEGRSKDGNDRTQSGLVKMLTLVGGRDWEAHVRAMNPVPVAISYEYDPCDIAKARERLQRAQSGESQKAPGEDLASMALGIKGDKGRVHLAVGSPLSEDWNEIASGQTRNDRVARLQTAIDNQIINLYSLWPSNYLAHDILTGKDTYRNHYTPTYRSGFEERLANRLEGEADGEALRELVLEMYANPVLNRWSTP